jgi:gamma-glutamylcyclotransferase (GGCT)/AIG2-like uncharacterized protein YtfP
MEVECLFVYGTLLPGQAPAEIAGAVRRLRLVGEGAIRARRYDLGSYPGVKLMPESEEQVRGAVFELPQEAAVLAELDAYEGFDPGDPESSLFTRERARVTLDGGGEWEAWVYVYNRPVW